MASKFSPSPWKSIQKGTQWYVVGPKNSDIAKLEGKANTKENASIIAAAPYMYEALKAVTGLIGDEDLPDNGELSGAAVSDMARNALAIAKEVNTMNNAKHLLEEREAQAVKHGTNPKRIYHTNPDGTRVFDWELTCLTCGKRHETRSIEAVRCAECGMKNVEQKKK